MAGKIDDHRGWAIEFDCRDCGRHILALGYLPGSQPGLCGTCDWIRRNFDPQDDVSAVRERLGVPLTRGQVGPHGIQPHPDDDRDRTEP